MSFKRISENYFLIDADGEKLSMNIERFLWHHCAFTLGRETENLKNVNLFIFFLFHSDSSRWYTSLIYISLL